VANPYNITATIMALDLTTVRIASLNERDDLPVGRAHIGLELLSSDDHSDGAWILKFLEALPDALDEFDPTYLLSAEVDSTGNVRRCWNLDICKNDKGVLVLRLGGNFFQVTQEGFNLSCGKLKGKLNFTVMKPLSGEYTQVTAKLVSTVNRETYIILVSVDRDWFDPATGAVCPDVGARLETELTLDEETDIRPWISLPKEPPLLMGVLGVGEFRVTSIQGPVPKQAASGRKWNQWRLVLDNGITVFSEAGTTDQLDGKPAIVESVQTKPWTLVVSKVEPLEPTQPGGEVRYRVVCALKPRAPMPVGRD